MTNPDDVTVNVDPDLIERYRDACKKRDLYEEIAQNIKAEVLTAMKINEDEWGTHAVVEGKPVLTYIQTWRTTLDVKRLKKISPQVFDQFSVTKPTTQLRWVK